MDAFSFISGLTVWHVSQSADVVTPLALLGITKNLSDVLPSEYQVRKNGKWPSIDRWVGKPSSRGVV